MTPELVQDTADNARIEPADWRRRLVNDAKEWVFQNLYVRFMDIVSNMVLKLPVPWVRHQYLTRVLGWQLANDVTIERAVQVIGTGPVVLGLATHVNGGAVLDTRGGLVIGQRVDIARGAQLLTSDHDPDSADFSQRWRSVQLGDRVWIATNAIVLPGSIIEAGVLVGAGAVAAGTLSAHGIYVGNPARRLRDRAPLAQGAKLRTAPRW